VHGEEDQAEGFASRLMQSGIGWATVPAIQSSVFTSPAPVKVNPEVTRTDGD